jgi:hypothetical protein
LWWGVCGAGGEGIVGELGFLCFVVALLSMVWFGEIFDVGLVGWWSGCSGWSRGFCAVVLEDQTFV